MSSIYRRYTAHFGHRLDAPFVLVQSHVGQVGTVCAYEHRPRNGSDAYFCANVDVRQPAGHQITGGYHAAKAAEAKARGGASLRVLWRLTQRACMRLPARWPTGDHPPVMQVSRPIGAPYRISLIPSAA